MDLQRVRCKSIAKCNGFAMDLQWPVVKPLQHAMRPLQNATVYIANCNGHRCNSIAKCNGFAMYLQCRWKLHPLPLQIAMPTIANCNGRPLQIATVDHCKLQRPGCSLQWVQRLILNSEN